MSHPSRSLAFGVALAMLAPLALLDALASVERRALGLTITPFGSLQLLAAHALAAAPLAFVAATAIVRRLGPRRGFPGEWVLLGLLAVAALGLGSGAIGAALTRSGAGLAVRSVGRSLAVALVALPWMVAALRRAACSEAARPGPGALAVAVVTVMALLPPAVFAERLAAARRDELAAHLETGRLARADRALEAWIDVAGGGVIDGQPADRLHAALRSELERLDRRARRPLPAEAPAEVALERAFGLIGLDRLEEADAVLRPIAQSSSTAALLRAATLRDLGRWDDCERQYRAVLATRAPDIGRDPAAAAECALAFDGIAESSRKAGRPERAEAAYRDAARVLPGQAAEFAAKLGAHYLNGGRPAAALAQFEEAIAREPARAAALAPLLRRLRVATPGCVLRRPEGTKGDIPAL